MNTSAIRTPTSDFDIAAALFAGLDKRSGELADLPWDDDADRERDESGESNEDALDLWSVLYGLE